MSNQIIIHRVDDVYVRVECSQSTLFDMCDYFTFFVPGYKFSPKFKKKQWDGQIRLLSKWDKQIYAGLTENIREFAQRRNIPCFVDDDVLKKDKVSPEEIYKFTQSLELTAGGNDIDMYDYQLFAVWKCLRDKRVLLESPTSSGKSSIIYAVIRAAQMKTKRKILLVVPNIGLVNQMFADFDDYSSKNVWNPRDNCHIISEGSEKFCEEKQVYISTWQSIYKQPELYFSQFDALIVDEAHLCTANSLRRIAESCKRCQWKIGLTGTVQDAKTHELVLIGLFGPIHKTISTKGLMDRKLVAKLDIKALQLMYPKEEREAYKRLKGPDGNPAKKFNYKDEMAFLVSHPRRNDFIAKLAIMQPNTGLVLFNTKAQGKALFESIKELAQKGRKVFYVDGGVDGATREHIRKQAELEPNAIIVASYGTFSTGMSIKNLHYVIFASPTKSKVRTLQSIGRGLRINATKFYVKLYDIFDDLRINGNTSASNYSLEHFLNRVEYYNREQFDVNIRKIKI